MINWDNLEVICELGNTRTDVEAGDKVKCISDYENNWGSCAPINGNLIVGEIYTVKFWEVHNWHTKVHLEEFPGKVFNSVHFEKVTL
jgi:regulator of RNase E activity RraA